MFDVKRQLILIHSEWPKLCVCHLECGRSKQCIIVTYKHHVYQVFLYTHVSANVFTDSAMRHIISI